MGKYLLLFVFSLFCVGCSSNNSPLKFNYGDVVTIDDTSAIVVEVGKNTPFSEPVYEVMFASGKRRAYTAKEIKFFTNFPWDVTDKDKTVDLLKNFEKLGIPDMAMPKMGPAT